MTARALRRVKAWLTDAIGDRRDPHDFIPRFGRNIRVPYTELRAVVRLAERAAEAERRALAVLAAVGISEGYGVAARGVWMRSGADHAGLFIALRDALAPPRAGKRR